MAENIKSIQYIRMNDGDYSFDEVTIGDISAENCTLNWVIGVAVTGTFVKDDNMEDWTIDSYDGIPDGWTVQNVS